MLTLTTNSIFASCYSTCVCDSGDACTTHTVGYVRDMEVIPIYAFDEEGRTGGDLSCYEG